MKITKAQQQRLDWIRETQMFQRIAQVEVSSDEELGAEWDKSHTKTQKTNRGIAIGEIKEEA